MRAPGVANVGLTDPDAGNGLVVLGGAASGYFGSPDYAANDLDGEFSDGSVPSPPRPTRPPPTW